jgi:LysR family transcriptional regulator (chromosome initiation inhibitor)
MGWGIAVLPELLARPAIERGELSPVLPEVGVDVMLHWHQWRLGSDSVPQPMMRHGLLDQIGQAILQGAHAALARAVPAPRLGADNLAHDSLDRGPGQPRAGI